MSTHRRYLARNQRLEKSTQHRLSSTELQLKLSSLETESVRPMRIGRSIYRSSTSTDQHFQARWYRRVLWWILTTRVILIRNFAPTMFPSLFSQRVLQLFKRTQRYIAIHPAPAFVRIRQIANAYRPFAFRDLQVWERDSERFKGLVIRVHCVLIQVVYTDRAPDMQHSEERLRLVQK